MSVTTKKQKKRFTRIKLGKTTEKRIKYVRPVVYPELINVNIFNVIRSVTFEQRNWNVKLHVLEDDGSVTDVRFRTLWDYTKKVDDFDSDPESALYPVKLFYTDGTWEYGFQTIRKEFDVPTGSKELVPMFVKCGPIRMDKWVSGRYKKPSAHVYPNDSPSPNVPYWVSRKLPYWNEKVVEKLEAYRKSRYRNTTNRDSKFELDPELEDFSTLHQYMNSDMNVISNAWYSVPKWGDKKIAWSRVYEDSNYRNYPGSWHENISQNNLSYNLVLKKYMNGMGWEINGEQIEMDEPTSTDYEYKYFKSLYVKKVKSKRMRKIYPVSSLINVTEGDLEHEIWNSMDDTLKGFVYQGCK